MNPAIKRFNDDVRRLHAAQKTRDNDKKTLTKDSGALKADQQALKHDRDLFVPAHKQMLQDRTPVQTMRQQMDAFQGQASQLEQQLQANPLDTSAQLQLAAVQQKEAALQPRLDAASAKLQTDTAKVSAERTKIATAKKDEKRDGGLVKKLSAQLKRARARVGSDSARAKKDLTPAEYTMGLKQTNAARRQVGLKPVHHVIRPGAISPQGQAQMRKLEQIAKGYASGRRPEGWCLKKVEDYLQTTSYGKIGHGNIPRFAYAHDFADYLNQGQRYKSLGLQKLHIDNPYKAPPGSIIVVRAGTPGTANPVAGDIVVKGYGDHFYNDGEMGYGGSGNFPKGNNYVLGIYAPK
jgi:hypothetical protein